MGQNREISVFLESLEGGGAEHVLLTLINAFIQRAHEVEVILCKSGGLYQKQLSPDVNLVELHARNLYYGLPRLVRYLRKMKPRVLLTTLNLASMVALIAKRLARVDTRVVIRIANTISQQPKNWLKKNLDHLLQRLIYPWADEIIAVSDGVGDDLSAHVGIHRERIITIYNPIITPELKELANTKLDHPWFMPDQPPVILGVGRLNVLKDFGTLIRAFSKISANHPARLLILGEGDQREHLETLVAELKITDKVSMPGFVDNPFQYMRNASVFALTSVSEGLPAVLIQALACGCSVVSTDCPNGPREILDHGRHGYLVPVRDSDAMAEAIIDALVQPRNQPENAWLAKFSLDNAVDEYLRILNKE